MDSSTSLLSSLQVICLSKLLEDNYKLALKLFVNRNFEKLYAVARQLYSQVVGEYHRGLVSEKLLVKIVCLYIAELTTISQEDQSATTGVSIEQVISDMERLFGNKRNVPPEILYNYYLAVKPNKVALLVILEINLILDTFQWRRDGSKYEKNLAQLYVDLLAEQERWDEAKSFIAGCPSFTTTDLDQLEDWRHHKEEERKQTQVQKQKQEADQKQKKADQLRAQRERQLEFVKLNEMRTPARPPPEPVELLRSRLEWVMALSRKYLKENGIILAAVIVLLAISLRFVKLNRQNVNSIKQRVVDTVKMAFKVTYM